MLQGAHADLSGKKLTACQTLISHKNGSVIDEGLYLGIAEKGGNRYLVVGQMILECITLLVSTGTDKAVTPDDGLFGKVVSMPGRHVDIAWEKLGHDMGKAFYDIKHQDKAIIPPTIFQKGIQGLRAGAKVHNATPVRMKGQ